MRLNKLMIVFLVIGILSSSLIAFKRLGIEADYKNYEVDFYYDELEKMAEQDEKSIDNTLVIMKDTGVNNVLIREETIQSMKQSPKYDIETKLDGYDMIVTSPDEGLIKYLYNAYNDVKKDDRDVVIEDKNTLRVEGKSYEQIMAPVNTINNYGQRGSSTPVWEGSVLETVGLGYDQEAINKAKEYGYGVVLIPYFNPDFQDGEKSIEKFFKTIDDNGIEPSHIFFSGNYVLGFDPLYLKTEEAKNSDTLPIKILANGLEDRNIAIGFIESSSQGGYLETEGLKQLASLMEYEATGAYLTWDFIQTKYDFKVPGHHNGEEITNIFFRGITTRNIRLINLKPFIVDNRYLTDPVAYKNVLGNLERRLEVHNVKPGRLQTLEFFEASNILRFFTALGILALAMILIDNLFNINKKWLYILLSISVVPTATVYFALESLQNIFDKIYALKGSIVGPVLAIFVLFTFIKDRYDKGEAASSSKAFLYSIAGLLYLIAICVISILFEIAMLANNRYFLGLDAFSGVKISQMVPILMVGIIYIAYYGYKNTDKKDELGLRLFDIKRFFVDDIKIWQIALVGIAVGTLLILLRRSGNTNGTPSMVEVLLRNVLEFTFPARPRTKAIFLGMPALILLTYNAYKVQLKKLLLPLAFVGSIAFVNTVNTFSHMKAPIYLSTYRTLAEIFVSIIIGLVIVIAEELILKLFKNKGKSNA